MEIIEDGKIHTFAIIIISILMGLIASGVGVVIAQLSSINQRYDAIDNRLSNIWQSWYDIENKEISRIDVLEARSSDNLNHVSDLEVRVRKLETESSRKDDHHKNDNGDPIQ